jgi:hypothetical protein
MRLRHAVEYFKNANWHFFSCLKKTKSPQHKTDRVLFYLCQLSNNMIKKHIIEFTIGICLLISGGAVFFYVEHFRHLQISNSTSDWGTFGDYIAGIVGTIFSFASLVLIFLTFKRQQETSVLQQFETTFFNLLNTQREMMKSVSGHFPNHQGDNVEFSGQAFFRKFADWLFSKYVFVPNMGTKEEVGNVLCDYYDECFDEPGPTLGPYYRHLYHFLKYTHTADIKGKQKYLDIFQSQMSDAELYSLFYNAICYGYEKMLPILDDYGFLENIERKSLSFDYQKNLFYPKTKFKYHTKDVPLSEME